MPDMKNSPCDACKDKSRCATCCVVDSDEYLEKKMHSVLGQIDLDQMRRIAIFPSEVRRMAPPEFHLRADPRPLFSSMALAPKIELPDAVCIAFAAGLHVHGNVKVEGTIKLKSKQAPQKSHQRGSKAFYTQQPEPVLEKPQELKWLRIGDIEVAPAALWKKMEWQDGKDYCASLGGFMPNGLQFERLLKSEDVCAEVGEQGIILEYFWSYSETRQGVGFSVAHCFAGWHEIVGSTKAKLWVIPCRKAEAEPEEWTRVGSIEFAPKSMWRYLNWDDGMEYCASIDCFVPDAPALEKLVGAHEFRRKAMTHKIEDKGIVFWCSSEYARTHAWGQRVSDGDKFYYNKHNSNWVVPCRQAD